MNYINIINMFKNFAISHPGIRRFRSDTQDMISNFVIENESFPVMYVTYLNSTTNSNDNYYKYRNWTFNVYILVPKIDLETSENDDILLNVTNNNINDTLRIIDDLFFKLQDEESIDNVTISHSYVNNYTSSVTSGIGATLSFDTEYIDDCYIPIYGSIVDTFECNTYEEEEDEE